MAELHNPLFENEKEFLERQKLEYERALLGDVDHIKARTVKASKIALIGAGVAGSIWLIAKAFGDKSDKKTNQKKLATKNRKKRLTAATEAGAVADDLGFGRSPEASGRRAPADPNVYHTDSENEAASAAERRYNSYNSYAADHDQAAGGSTSSLVTEAFHSFMQSDTGKMLIAQTTAVLMAYAAKKVGEYFPIAKNPDLAPTPAYEPETRDIEFTYHDDDANAPQQSS